MTLTAGTERIDETAMWNDVSDVPLEIRLWEPQKALHIGVVFV